MYVSSVQWHPVFFLFPTHAHSKLPTILHPDSILPIKSANTGWYDTLYFSPPRIIHHVLKRPNERDKKRHKSHERKGKKENKNYTRTAGKMHISFGQNERASFSSPRPIRHLSNGPQAHTEIHIYIHTWQKSSADKKRQWGVW